MNQGREHFLNPDRKCCVEVTERGCDLQERNLITERELRKYISKFYPIPSVKSLLPVLPIG